MIMAQICWIWNILKKLIITSLSDLINELFIINDMLQGSCIKDWDKQRFVKYMYIGGFVLYNM